MAFFNYTSKEITLKVVYYGPGFSGKTTNLQQLHSILPPDRRGKLISLATEADRTLFFDFLPVDFGKIKDFNIRFQLYTVPGQVKYNATRRLVLKGADAVVFVADSQREMKEQNIESFNNMKENLTFNGLDPEDIPLVFQYNKRDLQNIMSIEELNAYLNKDNFPFFEAVAAEAKGVQKTFKEITVVLLKHIEQKHKLDIEHPVEAAEPMEPIEFVKPVPESAIPEPSISRQQKLNMPPPPPQRISQFVKSIEVEEAIPQVPYAFDITKLVQAVGGLKNVMSEITSSLKDIQKTQEGIRKELFELKQIFSEAAKKKGLRRFFG